MENERQNKIQECREIYNIGKRAQTGDHVITAEEEALIYRYAGVDIGSILFAEIDQLNADHAFVLKLYEDLLVDYKTMDAERRTLRIEHGATHVAIEIADATRLLEIAVSG